MQAGETCVHEWQWLLEYHKSEASWCRLCGALRTRNALVVPVTHSEVRVLREALENYMCEFGQALEAHGIPFTPRQVVADKQAREALTHPHNAQGERYA